MRFFRTIWRDQRGYTLIEMVSMMAIMAVLSGLVIANTKTGDKNQKLRDAADNIVTIARQAEAYATSSQVVAGSSRPAYGICLAASGNCSLTGTTGHYLIYARQNSDSNFTQRPTLAPQDIIKYYSLSSGIVVQPLTTSGGLLGSLWVDYQPPGPTVRVNGASTTQIIRVRFQGGGPSYYKDIVINPGAGAVYVQ